MIPFQNGLLDLATGELVPATPANASTWILPFEYEREAQCPHFLTWLSEAVEGDEDTIALLRAWLNALLTSRSDLQVFLHLIGPGGTGKSTFGRLVFVLVGEENATTTSLKQLETNRFESANIFGKRLTAIEEAGKYGGSVSVLKAMTGQDPLRLERKNQQQQGSFIYKGQTLLMSNERLASSDYTSGIERRRVTVEFKKRVTQEERAAWAKRGGETEILHREAPGIINWALARLSQFDLRFHYFRPVLKRNLLKLR
nr:phage/plasmid primase, P4 family [Desulfogranum marinum]